MTDLHKSTRLGDILVERKIITRAQLLQAIELQQSRRLDAVHCNKPDSYRQELGEVLIELGFINRSQLKTGLGWQRRLRKATAAMVFIAPMLTACGGGGGGGGGNPTNYTPPASQVSQNVSSVSNAPDVPPTTVTNSSAQTMSSVPVVDAPSSEIASSPNAKSSSSKPSQIATPPTIISSSSFSSSVLSSLPKSSLSSSIKSSSSSSKPVQSSSSLASSTFSELARVDGPVQIYWNPPKERENGDYLDITEIGGYELRYKRKSDVYYTRVMINDGYADAYYFDYLQGEYEFQIAAFDKIGLYSTFVPIKASRDSR